MTKQKEIRKVIDSYTDDGCLYPKKTCAFFKGYYCTEGEGAYKCLMKRLGELGVVIKKDRELPPSRTNEGLKSVNWDDGYRHAEVRYKLAGYVAVEPLIKE